MIWVARVVEEGHPPAIPEVVAEAIGVQFRWSEVIIRVMEFPLAHLRKRV